MRRFLFGLIASLSLLAAVPAASAARSHPHARHHRSHARIEHFRRGGDVPSPLAGQQPGSQDAGAVQSFQNGVLTIKLNDGITVSGTVNQGTEVQCQSMSQGDFTRADGSGDSSGRDGSDDSGGDQSDDTGDGNGGAACMSALQTVGTPVLDATLKLTSNGAAWDRVDLDA